MNCPDCRSSLAARHEAEIELDTCARCKGLWFDHGEFDAFRARVPDAAERTTTGVFVPGSEFGSCPRCTTETLRFGEIGHRRAGGCTTCKGVWIGKPEEGGGWLGVAAASSLVDAVLLVLSGLA